MPSYNLQNDDSLPTQRRGFKLWPVVIFAIFAVYYYFSHQETNAYTGRKQLIDISPEQEAALGLQSYRQVLHDEHIISSGPQADLVKSVGARIAKAANESGFEWEFKLIDSEQINAFCLPGGKVAIYSGIIPVAGDENGLAVVMGHEIAHALSHHGAERMAQDKLAQFGQMAIGMAASDMDEGKRRAVMGAFGLGAQYGVLLPFSKKHESEADYIGLLLMSRACFDPRVAADFWTRMSEANTSRGAPPEFASTHPSDTRRIEQLKEWLPKALEEHSKFCGDTH